MIQQQVHDVQSKQDEYLDRQRSALGKFEEAHKKKKMIDRKKSDHTSALSSQKLSDKALSQRGYVYRDIDAINKKWNTIYNNNEDEKDENNAMFGKRRNVRKVSHRKKKSAGRKIKKSSRKMKKSKGKGRK